MLSPGYTINEQMVGTIKALLVQLDGKRIEGLSKEEREADFHLRMAVAWLIGARDEYIYDLPEPPYEEAGEKLLLAAGRLLKPPKEGDFGEEPFLAWEWRSFPDLDSMMFHLQDNQIAPIDCKVFHSTMTNGKLMWNLLVCKHTTRSTLTDNGSYARDTNGEKNQ